MYKISLQSHFVILRSYLIRRQRTFDKWTWFQYKNEFLCSLRSLRTTWL